MTVVYRLSSRRYPANSGKGAGLYGGRWNSVGIEVIYTAQSPSLAALEILVHYDVLPTDFVLTTIQIPDEVEVRVLKRLPANWDQEVPVPATRSVGDRWVRGSQRRY